MSDSISRNDVLREHGATDAELPELLHYTESSFTQGCWSEQGTFPLDDEPFVATWERYADEAKTRGAVAVLRERLVQLRFPIAAGMSAEAAYVAATRRGELDLVDRNDGARFEEPDGIRIFLHETAAGRIPVIVASARADFVTLLRALTRRNEPAAIPDAMGACIVAGYNNWDRVGALRRAWESTTGGEHSDAAWWAEFRTLMPQRERYQDRFILLSSGAYSATPAATLGFGDAEWLGHSLTIRLEHECAHYVTRRAFGSMQNSLMDELIADHLGISAVCGRFRASWFLRFMGLEDHPRVRAGGRLESYRGTPPLSESAFAVVRSLVVTAAVNLEAAEEPAGERAPTSYERAVMIGALAHLGLEAIASHDGVTLVRAARSQMRREIDALRHNGATDARARYAELAH